MGGYSQHILDPYLNPLIVNNFDEIDKYKDLAGQTYINEPLAKFGQQEQQKVFDGKIGSTMLAGAAKQSGARDIASLKASQRLGSGAMARMPGNASGAGVNLLYDRMLQQNINKVNDRTSDQIVGGLPGYVNSAAGWANAGNQGRATKMAMEQGYQGMFNANVQNRLKNETFDKKKSFWDKLKEGIGVAGNIVGIVSGIGAPFSMNSGGGNVNAPGGWVDPNQDMNWTG